MSSMSMTCAVTPTEFFPWKLSNVSSIPFSEGVLLSRELLVYYACSVGTDLAAAQTYLATRYVHVMKAEQYFNIKLSINVDY